MASPRSGTAPPPGAGQAPPLRIGTLLEHAPFQTTHRALHLGQHCRIMSLLSRPSHVSRTLAHAMMR